MSAYDREVSFCPAESAVRSKSILAKWSAKKNEFFLLQMRSRRFYSQCDTARLYLAEQEETQRLSHAAAAETEERASMMTAGKSVVAGAVNAAISFGRNKKKNGSSQSLERQPSSSDDEADGVEDESFATTKRFMPPAAAALLGRGMAYFGNGGKVVSSQPADDDVPTALPLRGKKFRDEMFLDGTGIPALVVSQADSNSSAAVSAQSSPVMVPFAGFPSTSPTARGAPNFLLPPSKGQTASATRQQSPSADAAMSSEARFSNALQKARSAFTSLAPGVILEASRRYSTMNSPQRSPQRTAPNSPTHQNDRSWSVLEGVGSVPPHHETSTSPPWAPSSALTPLPGRMTATSREASQDPPLPNTSHLPSPPPATAPTHLTQKALRSTLNYIMKHAPSSPVPSTYANVKSEASNEVYVLQLCTKPNVFRQWKRRHVFVMQHWVLIFRSSPKPLDRPADVFFLPLCKVSSDDTTPVYSRCPTASIRPATADGQVVPGGGSNAGAERNNGGGDNGTGDRAAGGGGGCVTLAFDDGDEYELWLTAVRTAHKKGLLHYHGKMRQQEQDGGAH